MFHVFGCHIGRCSKCALGFLIISKTRKQNVASCNKGIAANGGYCIVQLFEVRNVKWSLPQVLSIRTPLQDNNQKTHHGCLRLSQRNAMEDVEQAVARLQHQRHILLAVTLINQPCVQGTKVLMPGTARKPPPDCC